MKKIHLREVKSFAIGGKNDKYDHLSVWNMEFIIIYSFIK